jgi:hypothetical protein
MLTLFCIEMMVQAKGLYASLNNVVHVQVLLISFSAPITCQLVFFSCAIKNFMTAITLGLGTYLTLLRYYHFKCDTWDRDQQKIINK